MMEIGQITVAISHFSRDMKPNPLAPFPTREGGKFKASPCKGEEWKRGFPDPVKSQGYMGVISYFQMIY